MDFSAVLNALLAERGVSAYKLAKDIGHAPGMVGHWCRGERMPSAENLVKLADYFGVSVDYLLGRSDNPALTKVEPPAPAADPFEGIQFAAMGKTDKGIVDELAGVSEETKQDVLNIIAMMKKREKK